MLLLHGYRDTRATVEMTKKIRASLVGPATLVEFDAGHQMLAAQFPIKWSTAVQTFLKQIPAPQ